MGEYIGVNQFKRSEAADAQIVRWPARSRTSSLMPVKGNLTLKNLFPKEFTSEQGISSLRLRELLLS